MFIKYLKIFSILSIISVLALSCAGTKGFKIPTIGFQGITLDSVQPDFDLQSLKLDFGLKFIFRNPYGRALTVPAHQFKLLIDNKELPANIKQKDAFEVPAEGEKIEKYTFELDLSPNGVLQPFNLLGRDVPYKFISVVEISLPLKLGKKTFEFAHEDQIRLPLLPQVEADFSTPGKLELIGEMAEIDLKLFKDAMAPFIDMLINLKLNVGFTQVSVIDNLIQTVTPLDPQARTKWDEFKENWDDFKNSPAKIQYPAGNLDGIKVEIPFKLYNSNFFEIEVPAVFASAGFTNSNQSVTSFKAIPSGSQRTIPARSRKNMKLITEIRWSEIGGGFTNLLSGEQINVQLKGETNVDLGYGPVRVPFQLSTPIPIKLGN